MYRKPSTLFPVYGSYNKMPLFQISWSELICNAEATLAAQTLQLVQHADPKKHETSNSGGVCVLPDISNTLVKK